MPEIQMTTPDWVVLVVYLAAITAIGLVAGYKIKNTDQYFLGGRRFGKWIMIGQSFGTGTHSEMPVSLAGAVYNIGYSGIWFQWKNLFATPFFWLLAPLLRRVRRTTIAEMTEDRYGPWMGAIYTVFALLFFTIASATMLKGAAKVISQAVGGNVPVNAIVGAMTVAFLLYSFVGGLLAAAWTDFFQGFLIIALSFMLIPLGWRTVGGLSGMRHSLDAYKLSLATPHGIGLWFIFVLTLNGLIGVIAQPHQMAAVGSGKDEYSCRSGFFYGMFVKRFCTIGWAFVGLMVLAMMAQGSFGVHSLKDPEDAFGFACRHLLFPGGVGSLIAAVLAANMAACSAFTVDSGALFTNGFYRKYVAPTRGDRHFLWVGRLSGLLIAMGGVAYAVFFIERVLYSFLLTETMATFVGVSLLGGVVWKRANRWGAGASLVAAMSTNFIVYRLRQERLDAWDPNVFLAALAAGVLAFVAVSLLTKPEPKAQLDSFFGRLGTPADASIEAIAADADPVEMELQTAKAGRQLLLVNLFRPREAARGFGFFHAYRDDLVGFVKGWIIVAVMVLIAWACVRL
jgi:Na+/proline symporter